jgi:hypothetical protein
MRTTFENVPTIMFSQWPRQVQIPLENLILSCEADPVNLPNQEIHRVYPPLVLRSFVSLSVMSDLDYMHKFHQNLKILTIYIIIYTVYNEKFPYSRVYQKQELSVGQHARLFSILDSKTRAWVM